VTQPIGSTIDAVAGGTLMNKTEDEAYNFIKEMHSTIFNVPQNEDNLNGLEVSLKLMHLLCFLLKLML